MYYDDTPKPPKPPYNSTDYKYESPHSGRWLGGKAIYPEVTDPNKDGPYHGNFSELWRNKVQLLTLNNPDQIEVYFGNSLYKGSKDFVPNRVPEWEKYYNWSNEPHTDEKNMPAIGNFKGATSQTLELWDDYTQIRMQTRIDSVFREPDEDGNYPSQPRSLVHELFIPDWNGGGVTLPKNYPIKTAPWIGSIRIVEPPEFAGEVYHYSPIWDGYDYKDYWTGYQTSVGDLGDTQPPYGNRMLLIFNSPDGPPFDPEVMTFTSTVDDWYSWQGINAEKLTGKWQDGVFDYAPWDKLPPQDPPEKSADCFTPGTMIATPDGPRAIETLAVGDLVMTRDHGAQPVIWTGGSVVDREKLDLKPNLRPIMIKAGALGPNRPCRDMMVSPQHRVLASGPVVQRMFAVPEALVPAKFLLALPGVSAVSPDDGVHYIHVMLQDHELICADNLWAESMLAAPRAIANLTPAQRREITSIFPHLNRPAPRPEGVRTMIDGKRGRKLVERCLRNDKALQD